MLKNLTQYECVDNQALFEGWRLKLINKSPWVDYDTKTVIGEKAELVIIEDANRYRPSKDGTVKTNQYEKLIVKIKGEITAQSDIEVIVVNPVCKIYGEFRNNLSVIAEAIRPIEANNKVRISKEEA